MTQRWAPLFLSLLWLSTAQAADHCKIEKLNGIAPQKVGTWKVSVEKETKRRKPGDAFLGVDSASGKRCEIELDSWGEGLFSAQSDRFLLIVEQGDTRASTLTWIDPLACLALKNLRESGRVAVTDVEVSFSGGKDGPDTIPAKKFLLGPDCLPKE